MAKAGHQRIFVSYARKDGAELALRLQKDLTAAGFDVWLDTQRIDGGASWTVEIEQAIDRAQVVLALLTPGSYSSEICRAEQLRSLRKGKCVILRGNPDKAGQKSNYLRAELDRQTAAALNRLLSTGAARKALEHRPDTVSFHDACGFWDITTRSNANTLNIRLADTTVLLDRATEVVADKSDSEGLKLPNGLVTKCQIKLLRDMHIEMQQRFKTELDIIHRRTDERVEKRSRPV